MASRAAAKKTTPITSPKSQSSSSSKPKAVTKSDSSASKSSQKYDSKQGSVSSKTEQSVVTKTQESVVTKTQETVTTTREVVTKGSDSFLSIDSSDESNFSAMSPLSSPYASSDNSDNDANLDPDEERIKVGIRIRPLNSEELKDNTQESFFAKNTRTLGQNKEDATLERDWPFDYVFSPYTTSQEIYDMMANDMIFYGLQGFNGTLFAYGKTGSGKTYTMLGNKANPGVTTYALRDLFNRINTITVEEGANFQVFTSYVEIYNEELKDLLASPKKGDKGDKREKLVIKEDPNLGMYVKDLSEILVNSAEDVLDLIAAGEGSRIYGKTDANAHSSRSHVICRVTLKKALAGMSFTSGETKDGMGPARTTVLNFVDLAGSERQKKTNAEGQRLKEANAINKSLSALAAVISKLAAGSSHVPFRDSKLTHLLSTALGGNSKTSMIANINPAYRDLDENVNTLRYASRAKNVKNKSKINQMDNIETYLNQYWEQILSLQQQLLERQSTEQVKVEEQSRLVTELEQKYQIAEDKLRKAQHQMDVTSKKTEEEKREIELKIQQLEKKLEVKQKVESDFESIQETRSREVFDQLTRLKQELKFKEEESQQQIDYLLREMRDIEQKLKQVQDDVVIPEEEPNDSDDDFKIDLEQQEPFPNVEFDIPDGMILWYHSQVNKKISELALESKVQLLSKPPPNIPDFNAGLPAGLCVELDDIAVGIAIRADENLKLQAQRLAKFGVLEREFWYNYFAHVHAIKLDVVQKAQEICTRSAQNQFKNDQELLNLFMSLLENGVLIRKFGINGKREQVKMWLDGSRLCWSAVNPNGSHSTTNFVEIDLKTVLMLEVGKKTAVFQSGEALEAIDDQCFSFILENSTLDIEAGSYLERGAMLEGFYLLLNALTS